MFLQICLSYLQNLYTYSHYFFSEIINCFSWAKMYAMAKEFALH